MQTTVERREPSESCDLTAAIHQALAKLAKSLLAGITCIAYLKVLKANLLTDNAWLTSVSIWLQPILRYKYMLSLMHPPFITYATVPQNIWDIGTCGYWFKHVCLYSLRKPARHTLFMISALPVQHCRRNFLQKFESFCYMSFKMPGKWSYTQNGERENLKNHEY